MLLFALYWSPSQSAGPLQATGAATSPIMSDWQIPEAEHTGLAKDRSEIMCMAWTTCSSHLLGSRHCMLLMHWTHLKKVGKTVSRIFFFLKAMPFEHLGIPRKCSLHSNLFACDNFLFTLTSPSRTSFWTQSACSHGRSRRSRLRKAQTAWPQNFFIDRLNLSLYYKSGF